MHLAILTRPFSEKKFLRPSFWPFFLSAVHLKKSLVKNIAVAALKVERERGKEKTCENDARSISQKMRFLLFSLSLYLINVDILIIWSVHPSKTVFFQISPFSLCLSSFLVWTGIEANHFSAQFQSGFLLPSTFRPVPGKMFNSDITQPDNTIPLSLYLYNITLTLLASYSILSGWVAKESFS